MTSIEMILQRFHRRFILLIILVVTVLLVVRIFFLKPQLNAGFFVSQFVLQGCYFRAVRDFELPLPVSAQLE